MIRFSEDVRPVTDLRRKAHEMVAQVGRTGRPVLITQRGRGAAVLVSVETWEKAQERHELVLSILRGEQDFADGNTVGETEAMAAIREAAGLPE